MLRAIALYKKKEEAKTSYFFTNKDLIHLFVPLMVEQLLTYGVGFADSIMVAYVGEVAVSGVSLVNFLITLIISLFAALATGGAVIAGQYMGNKDMKNARQVATQLVWLAGFISLAVMAIIYLAKPFILGILFGQISDEVRAHAHIYLMIVAASIPFLAIYGAGAAIFRTMGNSKLPMKIMLSMNVLNVTGNAILIYGLKMGTEGIAIPTLVTRISAAIIITILILNRKNPLYIFRSLKPHFEWGKIKRIMGIGVPYAMENGIFYLGRLIVLCMVATLGTAAIAANAVAATIAVFQVMPGMAIGLGMTVVIARCVGAGDYEQAKYYNRKILGIIYLLNALSCILILTLLPFVLNIYGLSETATSLTTQIVWLHAIFTVFIWPLGYALPITFRAAGDARYPMIVGSLTMFFCRIGFAYLLGFYFNMGAIGVWLAIFIDWLVKGFLFTYRYLSGKWMAFRSI